MELWVRSQDKTELIVVKKFSIIGCTNNSYSGVEFNILSEQVYLGHYKTKERCLEILDEIQKFLVENSNPLVLLGSSIDDTDIQDGAIIEYSAKDKAKVFQKSALVYEMPEK